MAGTELLWVSGAVLLPTSSPIMAIFSDEHGNIPPVLEDVHVRTEVPTYLPRYLLRLGR